MSTSRGFSRSASTNVFFQRIQENERRIHLQKLKQIQSDTHGELKNVEHKARLKQLKKNKSASHKMEQLFDPTRLQNKALVTHISEIKKRRSEHGLSLRQINTHRSVKEDQKEQIKRQNKKLIMAILEQKSRITNKRDLKKEFKVYEEQRDKLRKVKSKSQL